MKVLGIDQSLSKAAFIKFVDGEVKEYSLSKTGKSTVKAKRKDTTYYKTLQEQIHHVCLHCIKVVEEFQPDHVVFEALSYASIGDATRNLACLYGALRETLINLGYSNNVTEVAPTSLKSYAHGFLKEDRKYDGVTKAGKPKKIKMDKKMMVEAVREIYGKDYLLEFNYSTGLDDLADATLLAHKVWSTYGKKS